MDQLSPITATEITGNGYQFDLPILDMNPPLPQGPLFLG